MGVSKIVSNLNALHCSRVGTPLYLAPELIKQIPYDYKVDMWSVGCSLYHLAALEPPFMGENVIVLGNNIVKTLHKKLSLSVSSNFEELIDKLLSKRADNRPSCSECFVYFPSKFVDDYRLRVKNYNSQMEMNKDSRNRFIKYKTINSVNNISDIDDDDIGEKKKSKDRLRSGLNKESKESKLYKINKENKDMKDTEKEVKAANTSNNKVINSNMSDAGITSKKENINNEIVKDNTNSINNKLSKKSSNYEMNYLKQINSNTKGNLFNSHTNLLDNNIKDQYSHRNLNNLKINSNINTIFNNKETANDLLNNLNNNSNRNSKAVLAFPNTNVNAQQSNKLSNNINTNITNTNSNYINGNNINNNTAKKKQSTSRPKTALNFNPVTKYRTNNTNITNNSNNNLISNFKSNSNFNYSNNLLLNNNFSKPLIPRLDNITEKKARPFTAINNINSKLRNKSNANSNIINININLFNIGVNELATLNPKYCNKENTNSILYYNPNCYSNSTSNKNKKGKNSVDLNGNGNLDVINKVLSNNNSHAKLSTLKKDLILPISHVNNKSSMDSIDNKILDKKNDCINKDKNDILDKDDNIVYTPVQITSKSSKFGLSHLKLNNQTEERKEVLNKDNNDINSNVKNNINNNLNVRKLNTDLPHSVIVEFPSRENESMSSHMKTGQVSPKFKESTIKETEVQENNNIPNNNERKIKFTSQLNKININNDSSSNKHVRPQSSKPNISRQAFNNKITSNPNFNLNLDNDIDSNNINNRERDLKAFDSLFKLLSTTTFKGSVVNMNFNSQGKMTVNDFKNIS